MQRSEDIDREAIRREVRAYATELLTNAEVGGRDPWQWSIDLLKCIAKWERRLVQAFDLTWKTLLVLSLSGVAAWFATAFRLWSGVGWQ